jgi:hypothetical protein
LKLINVTIFSNDESVSSGLNRLFGDLLQPPKFESLQEFTLELSKPAMQADQEVLRVVSRIRNDFQALINFKSFCNYDSTTNNNNENNKKRDVVTGCAITRQHLENESRIANTMRFLLWHKNTLQSVGFVGSCILNRENLLILGEALAQLPNLVELSFLGVCF